ncbi:hypothetical protein ACNKHS_05305 [Shigella flexneri]
MLTGEPRIKNARLVILVDALRLGGRRITSWNKKIIRRWSQGGFTGGNVDVDELRFHRIPHRTVNDCAYLRRKIRSIRIKGNLVSKPYIDIALNLISTFDLNLVIQPPQQL